MGKRKIDQYYDSQEGKKNKNKNERGGVDRNQQEGMLIKNKEEFVPAVSRGHPTPQQATLQH